ncbi:uncharacterized protein LOC143041536 isoform X2 [Oratosquilla oratoria]
MLDGGKVNKPESDESSIASDFSIIPESMNHFTAREGVDEQRGSNIFVKSEEARSAMQGSTTTFGKVLFQDIQASYTADSDIAVCYVLTKEVAAKPSDRVAVYRVGFGSPQDYLTYEWAPVPSDEHDNIPLTVIFKARNLPLEAGEFFQFCYVTHEGQIVGVSTPFQLRSVGEVGGEEVCDEEEEGMVMIRTNESVLHDKIANLHKMNEALLSKTSEMKQKVADLERLLEDKTNQYTVSQHHLQVLETKMKKESSEKCELMGRLGQVVEEKGNLEEKAKLLTKQVKQHEDISVQFNKIKNEKLAVEEELQQVRQSYKEAKCTLMSSQDQLQKSEESIKRLSEELSDVKMDYEGAKKDLEFWTKSAANDQSEKTCLAQKYADANREIVQLSKELDTSRKTIADLEDRLSFTVVELTSSKDELGKVSLQITDAEKKHKISEERQLVVEQDNEQLKQTIVELREQVSQFKKLQESAENGREAAERIACDLSQRLQSAQTEYHNLAHTNLKLAKKLKKLRQTSSVQDGDTMNQSCISRASDWYKVSEMADGLQDEDAEDKRSNFDQERPVNTSVMQQSCLSNSCSAVTHSTSTDEINETVKRNMQVILQELTCQITSLKQQLESKTTSSACSCHNLSSGNVSGAEYKSEVPGSGKEQEGKDKQQGVEKESKTCIPKSNASEPQVAAADQQMLYGSTFLPAQRTAPVFLPDNIKVKMGTGIFKNTLPQQQQHEGGQGVRVKTVLPSAPPLPSNVCAAQGQDSEYPKIIPGVTGTAMSASLKVTSQPTITSAPSALLATDGAENMKSSTLPPPLLPETTPTARQAAVLRHLQPQPQTAHPSGPESDDEDFHSTGESADVPVSSNGPDRTTGEPMQCPMCSLTFPRNALLLLEQHIGSHLEFVCPLCSLAFQRSSQKQFEQHVQDHFADEDGSKDDGDDPLSDPSGPWGKHFRGPRLLEID